MIRTNRHELAEKIRQLTKKVVTKYETPRKWDSLHYMQIKRESKVAEEILLSSDQKSLKPILFYQPIVITRRKLNQNVTIFVYTMPNVAEKKKEFVEPIALQTPPEKQATVEKKRRRSSTYNRIRQLLGKDQEIKISSESSEESIPQKDAEIKGIVDLSDDILEKVFWYFNLKERCSILSRVCKKWNTILKNPVFWTNLEFKGNRVPLVVILRLIERSSLLTSFKLTEVPEAGTILKTLCRDKVGLKELAVRYCSMDSIDCIHVLLQVPTSFPQLKILDLEGTGFDCKRFFMELCFLKKLKSLNLGANPFLNPRILMTISVNFRSLETLKILNIPSNIESKSRMTDANFSFVIDHLKNTLVHLEYDMQQLGNPAYMAILKCKKLQILCLTNCLFLTGSIFEKFSRLDKLKSLTVTRAICLKSADFETLLARDGLRNIEQLNVSGCWQIDGSALEAMADGLPKLKELSLEQCKSIRGRDVYQVTKFRRLSALNIAHSSIESDDLPIIVTGARGLRSLTIDQNMYRAGPIVDVTSISPDLKIDVTG